MERRVDRDCHQLKSMVWRREIYSFNLNAKRMYPSLSVYLGWPDKTICQWSLNRLFLTANVNDCRIRDVSPSCESVLLLSLAPVQDVAITAHFQWSSSRCIYIILYGIEELSLWSFTYIARKRKHKAFLSSIIWKFIVCLYRPSDELYPDLGYCREVCQEIEQGLGECR